MILFPNDIFYIFILFKTASISSSQVGLLKTGLTICFHFWLDCIIRKYTIVCINWAKFEWLLNNSLFCLAWIYSISLLKGSLEFFLYQFKLEVTGILNVRASMVLIQYITIVIKQIVCSIETVSMWKINKLQGLNISK